MRDGCDQPCTKLSRSRIAHTVGMSAGCEHPPQHRSAFLEDDEHQHPVQQPTRRSRDCWQLLAARGEGDAVRQGCGPHVHITDMRTAQLRTASHDGQHPCNLHDSCEAASHANSQRNVSMRAPPQRARVILHAPSHIPPPATEFSWRSAYDADKSLRVAAPQVATGRIRRARFADLRCPAILACSFALMLGSVEGQAICATHSTARGLATTSATAGIPASFTIQV